MNSAKKVELYRARFPCRDDVYAIIKRRADGNKVVYPQCENFWQPVCQLKHGVRGACNGCSFKKYLPRTDSVILNHLLGVEQHAYFLLKPDNTVGFFAADIDCKPGKEEKGYTFGDVVKFTRILRDWGLKYEIARSTTAGFHVYLFLDKPIRASIASAVLMEAFEIAGFMELFKRGLKGLPEGFPKATFLGAGGLSNPLKLPLIEPAMALGKNCFVSEDNKVIPDQWGHLAKAEVNASEYIEKLVVEKKMPVLELMRSVGLVRNRGKPLYSSTRAVKVNGTAQDLVDLSKLCATYFALVTKARNGEPLSHGERFRLAQLGIAIGLSDQELLRFFRKQSNFDERITLQQIDSVRAMAIWPSCDRLAADFGLCDGQCERARAARTKTPVNLIDWKRRNDG